MLDLLPHRVDVHDIRRRDQFGKPPRGLRVTRHRVFRRPDVGHADAARFQISHDIRTGVGRPGGDDRNLQPRANLRRRQACQDDRRPPVLAVDPGNGVKDAHR